MKIRIELNISHETLTRGNDTNLTLAWRVAVILAWHILLTLLRVTMLTWHVDNLKK